MKKVRNMFVLALVLLSIVSIGSVAGTYAKYTSTGTASDTARVAKFGINLEAPNSINLKLFKDSYTAPEGTNVTVASATTKSDGTKENVIAPGTTGSYDFVLATDAPEVAYTLSIVSDGSTIPAGLQDKLKFAVVEVTETPVDIADIEDEDWVTTVDALATKLNDSTDTIAAGTPVNISKRIIWKWDFNVDAAADTADTALGNETNLAEVAIGLKITATQVD